MGAALVIPTNDGRKMLIPSTAAQHPQGIQEAEGCGPVQEYARRSKQDGGAGEGDKGRVMGGFVRKGQSGRQCPRGRGRMEQLEKVHTREYR